MTLSVAIQMYNAPNLGRDLGILGFIEYLNCVHNTTISFNSINQEFKPYRMSHYICTVMPTYFVPFCPFLLKVPTYPKIGRPLWMFPSLNVA